MADREKKVVPDNGSSIREDPLTLKLFLFFGAGTFAYPVDLQSYAGGGPRAPGRSNQAGQVCLGEGSDKMTVPHRVDRALLHWQVAGPRREARTIFSGQGPMGGRVLQI